VRRFHDVADRHAAKQNAMALLWPGRSNETVHFVDYVTAHRSVSRVRQLLSHTCFSCIFYIEFLHLSGRWRARNLP
jgi:hypothetical protein